jgi:hypothetical protein
MYNITDEAEKGTFTLVSDLRCTIIKHATKETAMTLLCHIVKESLNTEDRNMSDYKVYDEITLETVATFHG